MAKKLNQQDLLKLTSIDTPPTDSVAFAAKSDGLYQKIGTVESKLSTTAELLDRVKKAVPSNAVFTDTKYTHPTSAGNKHIPTGGATNQILRYSASGTAVWSAEKNTTYGLVTTSANGLMSSTDKSKLNGIATGANNYVHPSGVYMSSAERTKLAGIATSANNYSLPIASGTTLGGIKVGSRLSISSGVLSANVQSDNNFTTALKNKLDGIATGATNLSLGTTSTTAYRGDRGNAAYAHITDTTKHITAAERTSWNNKYTKSEVDGLAKYIGRYSSANGFLVKTDVARTENSMLVLHIKGNSYGGGVPINTLVQVYNYVSSDSIIQTGALNNGYKINEIKAFYYNNLVYFWVPQQSSSQTMTFQLLKAEGQVNRVDSVTNATVPASGVEKMVTITPRTAWFEDTLTNLSQLTDNIGVATHIANTSNPHSVTKAQVGLGSVNNTADSAKNVLSATKLTTARTINGTSFNGSASITTANWGTARTLSYTGDVTGSSSINGSKNVATAMTLKNSGVTAGTYRSVTVDAKGRVTAGTKPTTVSAYGLTDAVTTNTTQTITGTKTFTKRIGANLGIKIGTHSTDGLIEWDATNNAFKFNGNLYATGGVSALGPGTGGGSSGGGVDMLDAWANYTTAKANYYVPSSLLVPFRNNTLSRLDSLESGSATSITTTGTGNAITSITKSGSVITATKGSTFALATHNHNTLYKPIGYVPTWGEITGKPSTFAPSAHTHTIANVTGLQTALNGKQATLTQGTNITISGSTISAVDTKYTPGTNIQISETNVISATDTKYTHPTTAGNKHIPSGGSANQFLKWSASGTAVWADAPGGGGAVSSVNGKIGAVTIDVQDISGLNSNTLALGEDSEASGSGAIALGMYSVASGINSVGIRGYAQGNRSTAVNGTVFGDNSVAIGGEIYDNNSVAIGYDSYGSAGAVAIGYKADAEEGSIAIGNQIWSGYNSVTIGQTANADEEGVAIGYNAHSEYGGTALGTSSSAGGESVALGYLATADGSYSYSIGTGTFSDEDYKGILGDYNTSWVIPGNLSVQGTKNFEMPHPKQEKSKTHKIRHASVETPSEGGTMYRYKVTSSKQEDTQIIELPDYFIHLNKDVQIFVTPQGHFGNGYGDINIDNETLEIHCEKEGEYNVLVLGTRKDSSASVQEWGIKGVERTVVENWKGEDITKEWEASKKMNETSYISYKGKYYYVDVEHISEEGWEPNTTPELFIELNL